jgi:hypothetical protein
VILSKTLSGAEDINKAEFKVFSQWGEDGIIQFILKKLNYQVEPSFVEFGVQDFTESNCRFLLMKDLWRGLIIDGSKKNIEFVQKDPISWRYQLTACCRFINRENIEEIILQNGFGGRIGILSIDLDGNDYWIWENIKNVSPDIVITEYNSIFGANRKVTIPYDKDFVRTKKHSSNLYWGASLAALNDLAEKKGYFLVGCNSNGNNAFFVSNNFTGKIEKKSPLQAFRNASFREARDKTGNLILTNQLDAIKFIDHMAIFDLDGQKEIKIRDLV